MDKLFFFDVETTGVKHWRNGIHQISGQIVIDLKVVDTFDYKVQPHPKSEIEDEAIKVGNVTLEQIQAYETMKRTHVKLINMLGKHVGRFDKLDKFHLVGYNNASFDNQFLRTFFTHNEDPYFGAWFWSDPIDVLVLASQYLKAERHTMPNFQLRTVAKHLGIPVEETKLHDAQYDIELTRRIYEIVTL